MQYDNGAIYKIKHSFRFLPSAQNAQENMFMGLISAYKKSFNVRYHHVPCDPLHFVEVGGFKSHENPNVGHLRGKFSWAQFLFKEAVLHRALRQDPRAGLEIFENTGKKCYLFLKCIFPYLWC
jgi:hypothetical protein